MPFYPSCPICQIPERLSLFGQRLVQAGLLEFSKMLQAEKESRSSGRELIDTVEQMIGQQLPADIQSMYWRLTRFEMKLLYGVEVFDPEITQISLNEISLLIDTLISVDICRHSQLLPLTKTEQEPISVLVAMVEPDSLFAEDELNRVLHPQGITFQRMVIAARDYHQIISPYLDGRVERHQILPQYPEYPDAESAHIVAFVNQLLVKALQGKVSNIYIEPQSEFLRIRFQKHGRSHEPFHLLPVEIAQPVADRIKTMANLDISALLTPQHGSIERIYKNRRVVFWVSFLPIASLNPVNYKLFFENPYLRWFQKITLLTLSTKYFNHSGEIIYIEIQDFS